MKKLILASTMAFATLTAMTAIEAAAAAPKCKISWLCPTAKYAAKERQKTVKQRGTVTIKSNTGSSTPEIKSRDIGLNMGPDKDVQVKNRDIGL